MLFFSGVFSSVSTTIDYSCLARVWVKDFSFSLPPFVENLHKKKKNNADKDQQHIVFFHNQTEMPGTDEHCQSATFVEREVLIAG